MITIPGSCLLALTNYSCFAECSWMCEDCNSTNDQSYDECSDCGAQTWICENKHLHFDNCSIRIKRCKTTCVYCEFVYGLSPKVLKVRHMHLLPFSSISLHEKLFLHQESTDRMTAILIHEFESMRGKPDGCVLVEGLLATKAEIYCLEDALEALPADDRSRSGKFSIYILVQFIPAHLCS